MTIIEKLTYYISETRIIFYSFLLIWLIGVFIKLFVYKSLKKWIILFSPFVLVVCGFVLWLFQTSNPLYKTYSADNQYSYYFEESNHNKILEFVREKLVESDFNWLNSKAVCFTLSIKGYKLLLYDEVEHKVLRSKYHDTRISEFGFIEEGNKFYFSRSDFYELPRPINKDAIEERWREFKNWWKSNFEIDEFIISPDEKLISKRKETIRPGESPLTVSEIDFDKTSLIFIGNNIIFKEYFPIKTVSVSSLKILHYSIGDDNKYTSILSPIENKIYMMRNREIDETIDIRGYSHITKQVFKNIKGELFYIPSGGTSLKEINIDVDESSLRHVVDDFYADKNGLYVFESNYGVQKLESNDENINKDILLYDKYFVYGKAVYPYGLVNYARDVKLNAGKERLLKTLNDTYLSDGETLLKMLRDNEWVLASPDSVIQTGTPMEPVNEWNWFDIVNVGNNMKGKTFYYPSEKTSAIDCIIGRCLLIKALDDFYAVTGSSNGPEAIKLKKVMIYNIDIKKYEHIEVDKFRRLTREHYIYKNRMYYYDSYPVETDIDVDNLNPILYNGKETEFYTDGKALMGTNNLSDFKMDEVDGHLWYKFAEPPFKDVDWESLRVVRRDIMIDKNNIYTGNPYRIIPIKNLGIDVQVVEMLMKTEEIS